MILHVCKVLLTVIDCNGNLVTGNICVFALFLFFIGFLTVFIRLYAKRLKKQINKEQIFFSSILDNANTMIIVIGVDGNIILLNKFAQKITGYKKEEMLGKSWTALLNRESSFYTSKFSKLVSNNEGTDIETAIIDKNGNKIHINWNINVIKGEKGELLYFVAIGSDISEKKDAERWIRRLAYNDVLTGLPNKAKLQEQLFKVIEFMKKKNKKVSLLLFDLDNFKAVNDTFNNTYADKLLVNVVERLKRHIAQNMFFSRYRSDEFAVIISGFDDIEQIKYLCKKILSAFSEPFIIDKRKIHLTVSIGVSIYPDDSESVEDLLKNADIAMRWVKENGKNNYRIFSKDLSNKIIEKSEIERDLRLALERQEFLVYYQPLINLVTGKIYGFEALLRWLHPSKGIISPSKFISVAEETGLIIPIGEWVIKTACTQMNDYIRSMNGAILLSINLSVQQLQSINIIDTIQKVLVDTGFNPRFLQLEITETTAVKNPDTTIHTLRELSKMGIKVALDDFGTGYSSLDYLNILPISSIKIDKSFIDELLVSSPGKTAITEAIILLAHRLKMKAIAEGVEKQEQLDILRKYNCDIVQGYYYSKPVPFDKIKELLCMDFS